MKRINQIVCIALLLWGSSLPCLAGYSASPTSTTSGGGTWGSLLRMSASISGTQATFTVSKQTGTFTSSGTMYLKEGSENGTTRGSKSVSAGASSTSLSLTLSGTSARSFYARYESSQGGYAWVGPIAISFTNNAPGAPFISGAPSSAKVDTSVSISVTRGADANGDQVKVRCTAIDSNRTDSNPYDSGLGTAGTSVTATFVFNSNGTKSVFCTSFDQHGAGSSTSSRTISITANQAPMVPTISSSPSSTRMGTTVNVSVTRGTDPDGDQVKVRCTAQDSNRTDSSPYDSGFGAGGTSVTASFLFNTTGTKTIWCASFDVNGAGGTTSQRTISVTANQVPTVPSISSSPISGLVGATINVSVSRGSDPDGDQVKVRCTAQDSNRTDTSPYDSGFGAGGTSVTASFLFNTVGTKTIWCASFDVNGAGGATSQRTISITTSLAPTVPTISSSPVSARVGVTVNISVSRGTDPDGDQVKVRCTAQDSNRTDASPYDSGFGTGGTSITASFLFGTTGTKTIWCACFDVFGTGGTTSQRTISITVNHVPTAPTISSSPASARVGTTVSIPVTRGTDSDGDQVKVRCTAQDSNRTDASPYDSGFGTGGTSITASFLFNTTGTKTIWCASFDVFGAGGTTSQRTISIAANQAPTVPSISGSPSSAQVGATVEVFVTRGTDPDGDQVKIRCTAQDSNRTDATPYDSGFGTGGTSDTASFLFNTTGTKTIWCASFDEFGAGGTTSERAISISATYVNVSDWAQAAAHFLVSQGIVNDPPNHDLRGTSDVNRAELATMIYRSLGGGAAADASFSGWYGVDPTPRFVDVTDPTVWYFKPASYLGGLEFGDGITVFDQGVGIFRPANPISKAWAVKALLEAWDIQPLTSFSGVTLFTDVPTNHPAAGYIYQAKQKGIVTGTNGLFQPDVLVDRQDVFVLLHRTLDAQANANALPVPSPAPLSSDDFAVARPLRRIGVRYEQPILWGVQVPRVSLTATALTRETVGPLAGIYVSTLEATLTGVDGRTFVDSQGISRVAHPFCAWSATSGSFLDSTPAGAVTFSRVRWLAPADVSPASGSAASFEITVYCGDDLGNEVRATRSLSLISQSGDATLPTILLSPLPTGKIGGQFVEIQGTAQDGGDTSDADYGILQVEVFFSSDVGATWTRLGTAALDGEGGWRFPWLLPPLTGTVQVRARATNLRGNTAQAQRSFSVAATLSFEGSVVDGRGRPLENALVTLAGGGVDASLATDNNGGFRFSNATGTALATGVTYALSASFEGKSATALGLTLSSEISTLSRILILDLAPPVTAATVPGGTYSNPQSVELVCIDDHSDCAATYYTLDGTTPGNSSALYTGPILMAVDTTLRFFSVDAAGNQEETVTEAYAFASCSFAIAPVSQGFESSGGVGLVTVTAPDECAWTAASSQAWLAVTGGASGEGNGAVEFSVEPNLGTLPRSGSLSISGQTFTVTQDGAETFTLTVEITGAGAGIVTSQPTGIDCPPDCFEDYPAGTTVTLTANPAPSSIFAGWTGGGCSGTGLCIAAVDAAKDLVANFVPLGACEDHLETGGGNWLEGKGPLDQGLGAGWGLVATASHSPSHSLAIAGEALVKDRLLVSRFPTVPKDASAELRFWHMITLQEGFSGGALEYSMDGGVTWVDILEGVGGLPNNPGRFLTGGYTSVLANCCSNPLAGRSVWSGSSAGWEEVVVDLSDMVGRSVLLRWRMSSGAGVEGGGWWIDDYTVSGVEACPFRAIFSDGFESGGLSRWSGSTP